MVHKATKSPMKRHAWAGAGRSRSTRKRAGHALTVVLACCALVFVVLAMLVAARWQPLIDADTAVTVAAHRAALAHGWLRASAGAVTALGGPGVVDMIAGVAVIALLAARRSSPAIAVAGARLSELGMESLVKSVLGRPRPVFIPPLATAPGPSFPSGHSAGSAAVFSVLVLLAMPRLSGRWRRRGLGVGAVLLLVLVIAASRVVLGVHFPSDALAGLALGFGCGVGAFTVARPTSQRPSPDHGDQRSDA